MNSALDQPARISRRWWLAVGAAALVQVALVLGLAERAPLPVRTIHREPRVTLASETAGELAALSDPTLFVWGGTPGFSAAAWRSSPVPVHRPPRYTEPPRYLALAPEDLSGLGALLAAEPGAVGPPPLMRFAPAPRNLPDVLATTTLPAHSTCELTAELASRLEPGMPSLPSQPYADVLADTHVQLRVDTAGRVQSCALLTRSGLPAADALALDTVRTFRFTPLPGSPLYPPAPTPPFATGEAIFRWHTVPPPAAAPGT